MPAMLFNRGDVEYGIEAPSGEMGEQVPYGEVASLLYGDRLYIAYCEDRDNGDPQIYRLAGTALVSGLEMVETEIQDTIFEEEDGEDTEEGEESEESEEDEDGEDTKDGEDGEESEAVEIEEIEEIEEK